MVWYSIKRYLVYLYTLCFGYRCALFSHYVGRYGAAQASTKYAPKLHRPGAMTGSRTLFVANGCRTRTLHMFGTPHCYAPMLLF